jgi:Bacterial Ig-like domain (group 3)
LYPDRDMTLTINTKIWPVTNRRTLKPARIAAMKEIPVRPSIPVIATTNWSTCALLMEKWRSARLSFSSLLLAGFACATILSVASFAASNSPLNFSNNYFVTGDYVVAGAYFMNVDVANGYATGTITIPDVNPGITGAKFVPAGAEVVAAVLYWQTVEKTAVVPGKTGSGENGFFRPVFIGGPQTGYPITGVYLGSQNAVPSSSGGCTGTSTSEVVRTYRANVASLLPRDANGNVLANGLYQVTLPSTTNSTPLTLGASLVLIYRILSPTVPLNSIVIYDGAFGQDNASLIMTQTVQGFYQAAASPVSRLTHIVGSGRSNKYQTVYLDNISLPSLYGSKEPPFPGWYGTWDNPTWTFGNPNVPAIPNPVKANNASATTEVVPSSSEEGCVSWGAVIVSTTVQSSDGDGLLDVWKQTPQGYPNPGYCDAAVDGGVCTPGSSSWVDLPGAKHGEKDVFVQFDYMCSEVTGGDSCTAPTDGVNYSFDPRLHIDPIDNNNPVQKVINAYANHGITLHVSPSPAVGVSPPATNQPDVHAVPEPYCQDTTVNGEPSLCPFPNPPGTTTNLGVVTWAGGLYSIKSQLIDPLEPTNLSVCTTSPQSCIPRFQAAAAPAKHYVLFGGAVGQPKWKLIGGTLTGVSQSGDKVTFTTSLPVGVLDSIGTNASNDNIPDPTCSGGRVTVFGAATNPYLNGTFCISSSTNTSFSITVGGTPTKTKTFYTLATDPNIGVAPGYTSTASGVSDVGGANSMVTLGLWGNPALSGLNAETSPASDGQNPLVIAGTFMHEFGHSNGLAHGGPTALFIQGSQPLQQILTNCKPNYLSAMSYSRQVEGVVDYSEGLLTSYPLNKSKPGTLLTGSGDTSWYVPWPAYYSSTGTAIGSAASAHCDGTPITNGAEMTRLGPFPLSLFSWKSPNSALPNSPDINFDGNTTETMLDFNDWANLDFAQIGATGANSSSSGPQFNGGGPQFNGGGPQFNGGGPQFNGGGPQFNGGGPQFNGGGEIDEATANSITRSPQSLMATEAQSPRTVTLNWTAPFGQIGSYNVYRSLDGVQSFSKIGTVSGNPPSTTFADTSLSCNATGYQYFVTAVLSSTSTNPGQESAPSNTVSVTSPDQYRMTGCYTNDPNPVTPPAIPPASTPVLNDLSFGPSNPVVQGTPIPITWTLQDDNTSDYSNPYVNRLAANSVVALGPFTFDGSCPASPGTNPPTIPLVTNGVLNAGGASTFGVNSGPNYKFTMNWDTTAATAGCYFFRLTTDSGQTETTSALTLLIYVSDSSPHVTTTALPPGVVGNAYSNTLYESGGTAPFAWSYTGSLPSGITLGPGTGTVSGTTCVAGNYSFTAKVTDKNLDYGTQGLTLQINQASTTTSVVSSPYPSTYGQAVTFTATVTPQYSCTPTGTVTFYDGATAISGAITLSSATAMFTTTALQLIAGTHSITAVYSGDSNFYATGSGGSTATVLSQTVNKASTTTLVVSSPNPSTYGQTVTFTTTVAPQYAGTPTGTVTFYDGATAISGAITLTGATAMFTTTALQLVAATHSITAVYSGDSNFYATGAGGSTATVLSQTVKPAMTATSVSSSLNPSTYGDLVTFTAVVSNASSTPATPTGLVQFVIDSGGRISGTPSACPTGAPAYSLCATTSTSSLTVSGSPHSVQANYINTDGDFLTSSGTLSQTVNQASSGTTVSTTTRMVLSPTSSNLGDLVTLTATVADSSNGSVGTPTGLVTFFANGMPIGTGTLAVVSGSDQATFTTSLLPVGSNSITAAYQGDTNFMGSATATAATETVALRATTVGVTLTPSAVMVGQASTVTVTVTDTGTTNPPGAADSWIATSGTPAVGTTGSTATLFADGMVLVAGGLNSGAAVNNAYIYNAVSGTFTATTGSLNTARTGATATLLANGEILIAGGSSDGTAASALNTAELYNPVTGAFTVAGVNSLPTNTMTAARFGATATLLTNGPVLTNGQVLIAGGENSGGALSSAELYNPATGTFTATTGPLGTARYDAAAALLLANGSVLIAGGASGSAALNSAELYSPSAGTFASTGTMAAARTGATATLLPNGYVLVAGGSSDGTAPNALNTAEIYNTAGGSFSASSSMLNTPRFNGTATLLPNGMVLLVGGGASGATAELYDADGDKFDATGSLLQADQPSLTATLLNKDHVLITGLTSGGSPGADAELYTPSFDPLGRVGLSSSDTSDSFGAACVLTISGGGVSTCTSTVTPVEVGTSPHTITGTYPADLVHSGSTGSAPLTVNKADTLTTVGSATSPSIYGQQVTFSATVSVVSPGAGSPTGSVQFVVDNSNYGSPVSLTGETASITDSALTAGSHTITAVYSGDPNFNATLSDAGSTATTASQTVQQATPAFSNLTPSQTISYGTATITVSGNLTAPTATPPNGDTVTVTIVGASVLTSVSLTVPLTGGAFTATLNTSAIPASATPYTIHYGFAGDPNFNPAGDSSTTLTVTPALSP